MSSAAGVRRLAAAGPRRTPSRRARWAGRSAGWAPWPRRLARHPASSCRPPRARTPRQRRNAALPGARSRGRRGDYCSSPRPRQRGRYSFGGAVAAEATRRTRSSRLALSEPASRPLGGEIELARRSTAHGGAERRTATRSTPRSSTAFAALDTRRAWSTGDAEDRMTWPERDRWRPAPPTLPLELRT